MYTWKYSKTNRLGWAGSLFNDMSTFVGYLTPEPSIVVLLFNP